MKTEAWAIAVVLAVCAAAPAAMGAEEMRFDADNSGTVERGEFPGPQDAFERLDRDGDGVLSAEEIRAGRGRSARPDDRPEGGSGRRWGAEGQRRRPVNPMLAIFDADRDGQVTREELVTAYAAMDANADGSVDDVESGRYCQVRMHLATLDQNGDGVVGKDEVEDRMWERVSRLDTDGDGKLTLAELDAFSAVGRGVGPGGGGMGGDPQQIVSRMERDGNGMVSRDEWRGGEDAFDRADTDADGFITAEELGEVREALGGRGGGLRAR